MHYIYHSELIRGREYKFTGRKKCNCPMNTNHWDPADFKKD